jgi:hypothetical protein
MRDLLKKADNWQDFYQKFRYDRHWVHDSQNCHFEEPYNEQLLSAFTGSFLPSMN